MNKLTKNFTNKVLKYKFSEVTNQRLGVGKTKNVTYS